MVLLKGGVGGRGKEKGGEKIGEKKRGKNSTTAPHPLAPAPNRKNLIGSKQKHKKQQSLHLCFFHLIKLRGKHGEKEKKKEQPPNSTALPGHPSRGIPQRSPSPSRTQPLFKLSPSSLCTEPQHNPREALGTGRNPRYGSGGGGGRDGRGVGRETAPPELRMQEIREKKK